MADNKHRAWISDTHDWELGVKSIEFPDRRDYPRPDFSAQDAPSLGSNCQTFESMPVILMPNQAIRVRITQHIAKHDHDSDVWQAALPSDGVVLRLEWEKQWKLRFDHEAIHPNAHLLRVSPPETKGTTCSQTLTLKQPLLIRHGIHFSWAGET